MEEMELFRETIGVLFPEGRIYISFEVYFVFQKSTGNLLRNRTVEE